MKILMRATAVVLLVVLIGAMVGPFGGVEASVNMWDKGAHFVAFGLILWSIGVLFRRVPRVWCAVAAVALGAAIELVQGQVGRDADAADLLADTLGILVALALWAAWRRFQPRTAFQTSNTR